MAETRASARTRAGPASAACVAAKVHRPPATVMGRPAWEWHLEPLQRLEATCQKFQAAEIGHLAVGKQSAVPVHLYLPVVSRSSSFAGPGPAFLSLGRFGLKLVDL